MATEWGFEHELGYCASLCAAGRGRCVGGAANIPSYLDCQAVKGPAAFVEAAKLVRDGLMEDAALLLRMASGSDDFFQAGMDEFYRQEQE